MNIYAHRGFSGYYPENTLLAFKKCLDLNIYGVEFDVHKTKDNKIVVIHDETVDRTFNGSGFIKDFTLDDLKNFDCIDKNYKSNKDCKIPTLEEVIEVFLPSNFILNIELKTDEIHYDNIEQDVINIIDKYNLHNQVLLSSFNFKSIEICKSIDPRLNTALLYHYPNLHVISTAKKLNCCAINPNMNLVHKSTVTKAHNNGLKVNTYTANSIDEMKRVINFNVDGIFTNFPDILIDLINV